MKATKLKGIQREPPPERARWALRDVRSIVHQAIAGWVEHNDANMGAALAFYTMFSIAPILVIAMAVAGYVFGPQVAETQVLEQLSALIGDTGAKAVRDLLLSAHYSDRRASRPPWALLPSWSGQQASSESCNTHSIGSGTRHQEKDAVVWWQFVRKRVLSIGLVLGVGFLLLVSLVASAALARVENFFDTFMTQWAVILPLD